MRILNAKNTELLITYSWSTINHGICGHVYEVIDYFWLLKDHFNCKILIPEDIPNFWGAVQDKYNFSAEELHDLMDGIIFMHKPLMVNANNILFTDGSYTNIKNIKTMCNKKFLFACGDKSIKENTDENTFILQDFRVYDPVKVNGINYIKKINFSIYKPECKESNAYMMYGTENCRKLDDSIIEKYKDKDLKILANDGVYPFETITLPVENLFDKFGTYVYTPVPRKFDCSSRLIPECKFYNKKVIYEIDYMPLDKGLYYRVQDTEHYFESLFLNQEDDIIHILRKHI